MTIELVEDKDCRNRTRQFIDKLIYKDSEHNDKQLEIDLVTKEDCSTIKWRWDQKLTKKQKGMKAKAYKYER